MRARPKRQLIRLRQLLDTGQIDPELWLMHFPETLDKKLPTCQDCSDLKAGVCKGGKDPLDCFLSQTAKGGFKVESFTDDSP